MQFQLGVKDGGMRCQRSILGSLPCVSRDQPIQWPSVTSAHKTSLCCLQTSSAPPFVQNTTSGVLLISHFEAQDNVRRMCSPNVLALPKHFYF